MRTGGELIVGAAALVALGLAGCTSPSQPSEGSGVTTSPAPQSAVPTSATPDPQVAVEEAALAIPPEDIGDWASIAVPGSEAEASRAATRDG
jgi:hypothetical protein